MPTIWVHQVYVLSEAASMPGAIQALDVAFPCDDNLPRDSAHPEYYASAYSANGQPPATHYGSAFAVTEAIRQNLESMSLDATPGITYWRSSNPDGMLALTNHPQDIAHIGQPWSWADCLSSMGLQLVVIPRNQEV
jgi:hypothetical protein